MNRLRNLLGRHSKRYFASETLRIALLAGPGVREGIERADAEPFLLDPTADRIDGEPDLVLVESSGLVRKDGGDLDIDLADRLAEMLRDCEAPSALWLSFAQDARRAPRALLESVDRIFAAHPYAAELASHHAPHRPRVLAPAAHPKALLEDPEKRDQIAYLGGYSARWSPESKAEATLMMRVMLGAGMRVLVSDEREVADLPRRYAGRVELHPNRDAAIAALAEFRAAVVPLLDADREALPAPVMDALAARVRVIVPRNVSLSMTLPKLLCFANSTEEMRSANECWRGGGPSWEAWVNAGRDVVRNAHTYDHRLATIASALGIRRLPVAEPAG